MIYPRPNESGTYRYSNSFLISPFLLQRSVSAGGAVPEVSGDGALELRMQRQEEVFAQIFSHLAAEESSTEATGW